MRCEYHSKSSPGTTLFFLPLRDVRCLFVQCQGEFDFILLYIMLILPPAGSPLLQPPGMIKKSAIETHYPVKQIVPFVHVEGLYVGYL